MKNTEYRIQETEDRRQKTGTAGFSLTEVLFAVLVLTMGLMFVASQFPAGMLNTRAVRDTTVNMIEAHNAEVMMGLQLEPMYYYASSGGLNEAIVTSNEDIHLLVKPNALVNGPMLVLDDPESHLPLKPLFWTSPTAPPADDALGDIGASVLPAVEETDQAVIDLLDNGVVATLDDAMFEVALSQRRYSWSALYRCLDPAGAGERTYRFYTFTLRAGIPQARYAMQDPAALDPTLPNYGKMIWLGRDEDRLFPVACRVDLNDPGIGPGNVGRVERNFIGAPPHTNTDPGLSVQPWPGEFPLSPDLVDILQRGSILIDADRENIDYDGNSNNTNWADNGYVYEVEDVAGNEVDGFELILRQRLQDDLNFVWVFPPAVERDAYGKVTGFADQQPVVKVSEKVVRF